MVQFSRVKEILDNVIAAWKQANGRDPDLAIHGGTFGWQTKDQLANAKAFNKRLIDPAKVGNGQGAQTNLVIALKTGVPPFERMPAGGPFVLDADIQEIIEWIDANMPDGAPVTPATGTLAVAAVPTPAAMPAVGPPTAKRMVVGLNRPVFAMSPPGDTKRLFIVEQHTGLIKILNLTNGRINPTPFLQVAGITTANEQGLLGLAFHPQYASTGLLYVNLTTRAGSNLATVIRRYQVSAANPDIADPASAQTVLTFPQPPFPNHKCGWLAFGPKDGLLYIGTGDGGSADDPGNRAQNLGELLGKMLRVDINGDDFPTDPNRNYKVPPTNPFVQQAGARPEIWAFGLRNPWRNSFDRQQGHLYIADVGQDDIEEINFQPASSPGGRNYGWRAKEGSKKNPAVNDPIPAGAVDPIHEDTHADGAAVVGGYVYRGAKIPSLQGTYFFGDFEGRIWSFRFTGGAVAEFTERSGQLTPAGGSIDSLSSFAEDAAGELYFMTLNGDLFAIQ